MAMGKASSKESAYYNHSQYLNALKTPLKMKKQINNFRT